MSAENALRAGCQSGMEKRMGRNFKQVARIAARRSGTERRWKMRLVRAGRQACQWWKAWWHKFIVVGEFVGASRF